MKTKHPFFASVCALAVPAALQSMLQASFSIVDQIMIGQLGSVSVAGVGLAGKFASVFSVVVSAVGAVAGIMMSQYFGQRNAREVKRSFWVNLSLSLAAAAVFTLLCALFPARVMRLYTTDPATEQAAAEYLAIIAWTFFPTAGATLLSTLFRCAEKPKLPLYAGIVSALMNTGINYVLIFGKCGFAPMGARGAAIATVIAQCANVLIMLALLPLCRKAMTGGSEAFVQGETRFNWGQYLGMLLPVLVCEGMWSVGENVYAAIYGHMGTLSSAAMTLINPVQGLVIGALCGLSQAASVLVGKRLGKGEYDRAYDEAKRLILYGALGAAMLSVVVAAMSGLYVEIYQVEASVKLLTRRLLYAYALIAPFKVLNMILGGGIIRSGGKTKYVMVIDMIGTWLIGVPVGYVSAFVLGLEIAYVYYLLSLEEVVRFVISVFVFRKRTWMQSLEAPGAPVV